MTAVINTVLHKIRMDLCLTAHYALLRAGIDHYARQQVIDRVCFTTGMEHCQEEAMDRWRCKVK
jgi:hypothetical protein